MRYFICTVFILFITCEINAKVIKSSEDGFIIEHQIKTDADIAEVFKTMTKDVGKWWNSEHTYSGQAENMLIDKDCFCERWDGNKVSHLDTTSWIENSQIVFEGAQGPLRELGLHGSMIWSLSENNPGTTVTWQYYVHGFSTVDIADFANVVDGVLSTQIESMGKLLEE